jgi:hypothetical protein
MEMSSDEKAFFSSFSTNLSVMFRPLSVLLSFTWAYHQISIIG